MIETLIAVSVTAALVGSAVPPLLDATARLRVRAASEEIRGVFRLAQSFALRYDTNVGVKFRVRPDGSVTFALYRDGDGDGVLTDDIDRGVDPELEPPRVLQHFGRSAGFGFPPGMVPRDLVDLAESGTGRGLRQALQGAVFDGSHPNSLRANVQRKDSRDVRRIRRFQ